MKPRVACGPHISGFVANQITAVVAKERRKLGFSKVMRPLSFVTYIQCNGTIGKSEVEYRDE